MSVDAARLAAYDTLNRVLMDGAYANIALKRMPAGFTPQDRRFVSRLIYETLENLIAIDYRLSSWADYAKTPPKVINALRMGVCQLFYMDKVPQYAACDSTVELVKPMGSAAFANAVMRNVIRAGNELALPSRDINPQLYLSVRYSFSPEIVRLWCEQLGEAQAEALMAYKPAQYLCVRANALKGMATDTLAGEFARGGAQVTRGRVEPDALYIQGAEDVAGSPLHTGGALAIQGEASQLCARICAQAAARGAAILDACAAPGGKSAAIAALLHNDCAITAWAVHAHRVDLMRRTFARLGVTCAAAEMHDARFADARTFDMVLCDAPCSALGTLWGKPEIKCRKELNIDQLVKTQRSILANAAKLVAVGGQLLYATCTISQAENQDNVDWFLTRHRGFAPGDLCAHLPAALHGDVRGGCMLQLLPTAHGTQGFFLALLQRRK